MDFRDRTVLVTGASRGIGAAIAKAFAAEGAAVAVNYLQNAEAAEAVAAACRDLGREAGGDAWAVQADVTDAEAVNRMVQRTAEEFGKIDVVVNNAFRPYAFDPEKRKLFWDTEWADYRGQVDGALLGTYNVCRAVLPVMRRRPGGSIVNMATDLVARPTVPYHDYTTAKAALVGFSRNLAAELGPLGIRVNCVAPGLVYPTDASRATKEDVKDAIVAQTPLRRIATPEDVTGPVLFLASGWSRFMTGQVLYVDGGLVMG
ncbi:3-oxoacyl-ACP reductase [Azospirillum argentinense]|uniref:3-oxoacyl-ACP reductase n=1 Tax=Azospirillum argentinense TaxID=2970906 RepID=A0A5B0KS98_9PROT|nr:3-oxoacyl-ACP reductase [Azospirillum argentinense]KAA1053654.1 3-oxoacyl-[acyl-carrier protein] reductase [Azospirillum argentinense]